jgi:hypothetical protein
MQNFRSFHPVTFNTAQCPEIAMFRVGAVLEALNGLFKGITLIFFAVAKRTTVSISPLFALGSTQTLWPSATATKPEYTIA